MIALDPLDGDRPGAGADSPILVAQILGEIVEQPMAALLRLKHQRECGVAGDADLLQRVHLHGNGQAHCLPPIRSGGLVTRARHWGGGAAGVAER